MKSEAVLLPRLFMAAVCGALIGWDRWRYHKPAGMRTHAMVALGSATLTAMAQLLVLHPSESGDEGRIVQGILAGIGFIGAGTILRQGTTVVGLTTASTIWMAAALGTAAGLGYYLLSLGALALSFFVVDFGGWVEHRIGHVEDEPVQPGGGSQPD